MASVRSCKRGIRKRGFDMTNPVYMSFLLAFLALSGTTVITFLASFTQEAQEYRYLKTALISETCVNAIAGFTYVYFMTYLYDSNITLENVTSLRYIDWVLTTPFLLLSFALFSSYSFDKEDNIDLTPIIYIVVLNTFMLVFGFLGEEGQISNRLALIGGFAAFIGLFYTIWDAYVKDKSSEMTNIFIPFLIIWALYGIAFLFSGAAKEISYNFLDLVSKTGFGIFLWASNVDRDDSTCNQECKSGS